MDVKSEIAGKVWQIEARPGDQVAEDDVLLILESMKMEIPITAPADGEIAEILVAVDEPVVEDQIVAVLKT